MITSGDPAARNLALPEMQARLSARLVTLSGSQPSLRFDAVRNSQDIIEPMFTQRGMTVLPVDLGDWSLRKTPSILTALHDAQPDVILMQYPTSAFGHRLGPIALGAVQNFAPLVVMLHEFVAAHTVRKIAEMPLLTAATLIGTTAERERKAISRWYPWVRSKLRNIPIASNIPPRCWAPSQPAQVVYFGQIRPEKGLEQFLACKAGITRALPGIDFKIIGATMSNFADYAERIIAAASEAGVSVIGETDAETVADLLASATVALLPYPEGVSFRRGSLLAAAACAVPIVTNVGPDTPDSMLPFVERTVTTDDMVALTLCYLTDKARQITAHQRSVALRTMVGWDQSVDQYLAVFREAMETRRRRYKP